MVMLSVSEMGRFEGLLCCTYPNGSGWIGGVYGFLFLFSFVHYFSHYIIA